MAKDGTARGGARIGAGKKRKALIDKINDGDHATVLEAPELENITELDDPTELTGADVPPVKEYMKARQKVGKLCAEEIYATTWKWLKARRCDTFVSPQLIEQYAMSVSRWIQCEECISEYGFLAKHPTSGAPIRSPYVAMSQEYMKQTNQIWYQIYQIVKENCSVDYQGATPQDDVMERLLRSRKGR